MCFQDKNSQRRRDGGHRDGAGGKDGDDLGAHVPGESSIEVIQMVAYMACGMRGGRVAELRLAYPIGTEAAGLAARKLVHEPGMAPLTPTVGAIEPLRI